MLDGQLTGGDDTFGLVTDVEQNLVAVNLDNYTFDEISVVEVLDGCVHCGEKFFSSTNVVDCNNRSTCLLGGRDGHVVGAPMWIVGFANSQAGRERSLPARWEPELLGLQGFLRNTWCTYCASQDRRNGPFHA